MLPEISKTRKTDVVETIHSVQVRDPYRWLEDNGHPEVQAWLTQQAAYATAYFAGIPVRERLSKRFKRLFSLDTIGIPVPKRGRYFFTERKGHQDMAVLYAQEGLGGTPRVLIDPNTLSKDKTTTLKTWAPSRDGRLLAYTLSRAGNDRAQICVLNVDTGRNLADIIPEEGYPAITAWNSDGSGFWYTKRDPNVPAKETKFYQRVYFHKLGDDFRTDPLTFGAHLAKEDMPWVSLSEDGRYLLATVFGLSGNRKWSELFLKDLADADGGFVPVVARTPGTQYSGVMHRGVIYIRTNREAPRWQIVTMSIQDVLAGTRILKTLIPEGDETLEGCTLVRDHLFVLSLENVHTVLRQYDLAGSFVREIPLPALGSAYGLYCETEGREAFFHFSSFAVPPTIYRIDLVSGDIRVFKKMKAGFDAHKLEVEQVWYPSKDGTQIPMFLVHKKGLSRNGNNPTMLYGYGGFQNSLTPSFMKSIVPFVERGGIFAIANLRGGGEFGKAWYEAGIREHKQNVFDDFIAAAEWLIAQGYTRRERLALSGASNGGLLVTAVLTQRPDLVKAVVAAVPVTDMLRYHLFFGGRHWIPDYGCAEEEDLFPYLLGYSPYHNVRDGEHYPATLIATSDNDDRVHPLHSYKMAARLQEANASGKPILLRVELKAGHGGASAISKYIEREADHWSFVFDQLGMISPRTSRLTGVRE